MPHWPDYYTVQNEPVSGVTSLVRRPYGQLARDGDETMAEFKDAMFAHNVAVLLNEAAMGERTAEMLIPEKDRYAARLTRKFAPRPRKGLEHIFAE